MGALGRWLYIGSFISGCRLSGRTPANEIAAPPTATTMNGDNPAKGPSPPQKLVPQVRTVKRQKYLLGSVSQIDRAMPVRHAKSCRWRSQRRILHLKPRRGGPTLAQGNALGNAVQISPSPERAFQFQTAILGCIIAPLQGLDSFCCAANPGRRPGLKLGRATEVGLARLRRD